MFKWLAWFASATVSFVAIALQLGFLTFGHGAYGLSVFLAYALVAFLMDLAWRNSTQKYPTYKRHLIILTLMALLAAIAEFCTLHIVSPTWLLVCIGTIFGLSIGSLPFILGSRNPVYGWRRGTSRRPAPSRPFVIVADPHWREELTGLFKATQTMPGADWLFLGDVFDVWVGIDGFGTDAQRSFLQWVAERRGQGRWVGIWLGNREYFLDGIAKQFDFMGEGVGGRLDGEAFAFEHGDLINTKDRQYRFWNLCSRSGPLWLSGKILPSFMGKKLASVLEKRLKTTNAQYKAKFPMAEFQLAAKQSNSTCFMTGHFHSYEEVECGYSIPWAHDGDFFVWQNGRLAALN